MSSGGQSKRGAPKGQKDESNQQKRGNVKVIFGTMTLAGSVDQTTSRQMLDIFFSNPSVKDAGPEIDTAFLYEDGKTEELLGTIMTEEERKSIFIATKVNPWNPDGLKPESILKQFETSLKNLKVEKVDLLYLHAPDAKTPIESTLEAIQKLYEQGKFKELGLSNYPAWQVADIVHICKKNGWVSPTAYQGMYNALTRDVERELLPCLRRFGIRFYAFNPLAGGILTGKYSNHGQKPKTGRFKERPHYMNRFWKKSYFDAVELVKKACEAAQIDVAQASLAWMRHHSKLGLGLDIGNDAVIIGQSSLAHLETNLAGCFHDPLPTEVVKAFDEGWKLCKSDCPAYFQ